MKKIINNNFVDKNLTTKVTFEKLPGMSFFLWLRVWEDFHLP